MNARSVARAITTRALGAAVVVWGSVTLLVAVFWMLPGDRVDAVLAGDRYVSEDVRLATVERLGLDEPLLVQYGRYWQGVVQGDLGESFVTGRPVTSILGDAAPASLRLAFWAIVVELIGGVLLAFFLHRRGRKVSRVLMSVATAVVLSVPVFVVGVLLQLMLAVQPSKRDWPEVLQFPVQGIGPDQWWLGVIPAGDQWRSLLLPALTLAAASTAIVYRLAMSNLDSAERQPHVLGARARGLSERLVHRRHIARNAALPVLTFVALDLANLFGAAVITESIFNWPGVGGEIAAALERQDVPVVLGITMVLGCLYVVTNLVVDLLYLLLDPRTREPLR